MIVEQDRDAYARAAVDGGRTRHVVIEAPLRVELDMRVIYARELLAKLKDAIAANEAFETGMIKIDLPTSVVLDRAQISQLLETLVEVTR